MRQKRSASYSAIIKLTKLNSEQEPNAAKEEPATPQQAHRNVPGDENVFCIECVPPLRSQLLRNKLTEMSQVFEISFSCRVRNTLGTHLKHIRNTLGTCRRSFLAI